MHTLAIRAAISRKPTIFHKSVVDRFTQNFFAHGMVGHRFNRCDGRIAVARMDIKSERQVHFFVMQVTALSIAASVLSTMLLMTVFDLGIHPIGVVVSAAVPAVVAPMVSFGIAKAYLDLTRAQQELTRVAQTDALTGLLNRIAFSTKSETILNSKFEPSKTPCLLYIDADHFKDINDTFGHLAGDEALRILADCLRQCCRATDLIGRIGGEEFAILLTHAGIDGGQAAAERIRRTVETSHVEWHGARLDLSVSIGVAPFRKGEDLDRLLSAGDAALYRAKANGRNCWMMRDDIRLRPDAIANSGDVTALEPSRRDNPIPVPLTA